MLPFIIGGVGLFAVFAAAAFVFLSQSPKETDNKTAQTQTEQEALAQATDQEKPETKEELETKEEIETKEEVETKEKVATKKIKKQPQPKKQTKKQTNVKKQTKTSRSLTPPPKETEIRMQQDYKVTLSVASKKQVKLGCTDGQTRRFSGQISLTFERETKCTIDVDGSMQLFKVKKSGSIRCSGVQGERCVVR